MRRCARACGLGAPGPACVFEVRPPRVEPSPGTGKARVRGNKGDTVPDGPLPRH